MALVMLCLIDKFYDLYFSPAWVSMLNNNNNSVQHVIHGVFCLFVL
jgi:hypothetical protein